MISPKNRANNTIRGATSSSGHACTHADRRDERSVPGLTWLGEFRVFMRPPFGDFLEFARPSLGEFPVFTWLPVGELIEFILLPMSFPPSYWCKVLLLPPGLDAV